LKKRIRTVDIARSVSLSTQTVRDYERWGFIPPVERSAQGYRLYSPLHLQAIRTTRAVIAGFGWERALRIMRFIHHDDLAAALAEIDAHHATVHSNRCELKKTLDILHTISTSTPFVSLDEVRNEAKQLAHLSVGQAACLVGVRVSTLRYWEAQGLVFPLRTHPSNYRFYTSELIRQLQIIALLRKAGYAIETIRTVLTQLATGVPEQALAAAEQRLKDLIEISCLSVKATALLWAYVEERAGTLRS